MPKITISPTVSRRADLRLASLLLIATGLTALGHQVLWTRRMIDLLGASTESTVRVFVCFFLGLALGAAWASTVVAKLQRPWRFLMWIETAVALTSLPLITLPFWSGWIWSALGPNQLLSSFGVMVKTSISLLLLLPPAVLMGTTLPVVASAVCVDGTGHQRQAVRLYAFNTLGGVLGLALVAGVTIPRLGVPWSMVLFAGINVLVAVVCYRRSVRAPERQPSALVGLGVSVEQQGMPRLALALAGFSGAGVMAIEVLALQLVNLSVPMSFYPPAAVLFSVILLLALAALSVPYAIRRWVSPEAVLLPSLAMTGIATTLMPVILLSFGVARTAELVYSDSVAGFLGRTVGLTLVALGPAVFFSGFVFPLAVSLCKGSGSTVGRRLGLLLALNGVGGVLGAGLARSLLLPHFGVHVSLGIVGAAYAVAAGAVALGTQRRTVIGQASAVMSVVFTTVVTVVWLAKLPLFYWGDAYTVLEVRPGREGVLTVFEREGFGRGMSYDNQYLLGGSGSLDQQQRQSHIPLLLHPAPLEVGYAGLGTGITASGALQHAAVKHITAVELLDMVVDAAATHFTEFNGDIVRATNAVIVVEDARTYFAACEDRFDVIIGDLFTPWRPGEAGLASKEYFQAAQQALRSGGIFCQWVPMHQLTEPEFRVIVATFRSVFPRAFAFRNHLTTSSIPLGLVGFKDASLDWEVVRSRCDAEREFGELRDPLCRHPEGMAMLYFGELDGSPPRRPFNTLANMWVELSASLNLVTPKAGMWFSFDADGNPFLDFVRERRAAWPHDRSVPHDLRPFLETGLLVSRLEVAYEVNHPSAPVLAAELKLKFPGNVLLDEGADWRLWAGNAATLNFLRPPVESSPNVTIDQ